jgi:hypothetical protein
MEASGKGEQKRLVRCIRVAAVGDVGQPRSLPVWVQSGMSEGLDEFWRMAASIRPRLLARPAPIPGGLVFRTPPI